MQNTTPTNTFQGNIFHAKVDVAVFVATFTQEVRSLFKRGVKAKSPHYKLDLPSLYTIDLVLLRNKMFWLKYKIGSLKTDFFTGAGLTILSKHKKAHKTNVFPLPCQMGRGRRTFDLGHTLGLEASLTKKFVLQ